MRNPCEILWFGRGFGERAIVDAVRREDRVRIDAALRLEEARRCDIYTIDARDEGSLRRRHWPALGRPGELIVDVVARRGLHPLDRFGELGVPDLELDPRAPLLAQPPYAMRNASTVERTPNEPRMVDSRKANSRVENKHWASARDALHRGMGEALAPVQRWRDPRDGKMRGEPRQNLMPALRCDGPVIGDEREDADHLRHSRPTR